MRHQEVAVGSQWHVRIGGQNVLVQVLEKIRKPSGRYEFKVQRVGAGGVLEGRKLTRGSGTLKPVGSSTPTSPRKPPPPRVKAKTAPARPAVKAKAPAKKPARPKASAWFETDAKANALGSLRGSRPAVKASPRPRKPKEEYPSKLAEQLCKAVKATNGTEYSIRAAVTDVMAKHSYEKYRVV